MERSLIETVRLKKKRRRKNRYGSATVDSIMGPHKLCLHILWSSQIRASKMWERELERREEVCWS